MGAPTSHLARRPWSTPPRGRWLNRWDGARESRLTFKRHVRTAAAGERATRRRVNARRSGRAHRHAGASQCLSISVDRRADTGHRSTPRHGEVALQGANATLDETLTLVARQLSLRLLPRTRRHHRPRRTAKPRWTPRMDQRGGGLSASQHAKGRPVARGDRVAHALRATGPRRAVVALASPA